MSFLEKEFRPFSFRWFIQRIMVVIRERRLPDLYLIRKKMKRPAVTAKAPPASVAKPMHRRNRLGMTEFEEHLISDEAGDFGKFPVFPQQPERKKYINEFFDQVYVISHRLRSAERLRIVSRLQQLNIEAVVTECEGELALGKDTGINLYDENSAGYRQTFRKILSDAVDNNYRKILCLQDAVVFSHGFHDKFRLAAGKLPDNWKILFLGDIKDNLKKTGIFALGIHTGIFPQIIGELDRNEPSGISGIMHDIAAQDRSQCIVLSPHLVIPDISGKRLNNTSMAESVCNMYGWDYDDYDHEDERALISVIMPAYNAARTIERSIRSILNQSYTNLEMIVSNDGSQDNTSDIVKKLMKEDPRVKLIDNKVNRGCYFARNDAVRETSGKYIAIQDADDLSFSRRLEKQLIPIVSGNAEFTLSWILRSRLDISAFDDKDEQAMMKIALENRQLQENGRYGYWDKPILGFMTSFYKKSLFEELGLFWEYRFGSDAEFFERILFHRTGMVIPMGEENVHTFLRKTGFIPGIFKRIEEILLISAEMNEQNITNTYQKEELNNFIQNYRKKYLGEYGYEYPRLDG